MRGKQKIKRCTGALAGARTPVLDFPRKEFWRVATETAAATAAGAAGLVQDNGEISRLFYNYLIGLGQMIPYTRYTFSLSHLNNCLL